VNYVLSVLVYIQRVDGDLPLVDFENYESTRAYYLKLVDPFLGDIPQELVDAFYDAIHGIPDSMQENAHRIMRETCEGVHEILEQNKQTEAYETAVKVVKRMNEDLNRLADLVEEASGDDFLKSLKSSKVSDTILKDPAGKGGDYEVVG
jgi:hypothetical protein